MGLASACEMGSHCRLWGTGVTGSDYAGCCVFYRPGRISETSWEAAVIMQAR